MSENVIGHFDTRQGNRATIYKGGQPSIHDRLARVIRDELHQRYATVEDQADAMAAAVIAYLNDSEATK